MKKRKEKKWTAEGGVQTPYQRAGQEWDNRMGSAIVASKNWRLAWFFTFMMLGVAIAGLIYLGQQPKTIPHIVEIYQDGSNVYKGPVGQSWNNWTPKAIDVKFHLRRFLVNTREIIADPIVMKQRWYDVYALLTPAGAAEMTEWVRINNPMAKIDKQRAEIQILSMMMLSEANTWQCDWLETTKDAKGQELHKKKWRSVFLIKFEQPKNQTQMEKNPIGLYIDDFNWSEIL